MSTHIDSSKLRQRVEGLSQIEHLLSQSLNEVILSYKGQRFQNSTIDKSQFFEECINLQLSTRSEDLLAERCKLSFHRDLRSSIEYGLDLVFGWLSEDLILKILLRQGLVAELSGEDQHREFLLPNEIGTTSDLLIIVNGVSRPLEIVFSWNNYWKKTDRWDLRDSKFRHLIRLGNESLCLGIELPSLEGFFVDMKGVQAAFIARPNPAWGNKNSYTLVGMRTRLKKIELLLNDLTPLNK